MEMRIEVNVGNESVYTQYLQVKNKKGVNKIVDSLEEFFMDLDFEY